MIKFPTFSIYGKGTTPSPAPAAPATAASPLLQGRAVEVQSATAPAKNNVGVIACKVAIIAVAALGAAALGLALTAANLVAAKFCPPALLGTLPASAALIAYLGDKGRELINSTFAKLDGKQPESQTRVVDLAEITQDTPTSTTWYQKFLRRGQQAETTRPTLDESASCASAMQTDIRLQASAPDLIDDLSGPKQGPLLKDLAAGLLKIIQQGPVEPVNRQEKQDQARALFQNFIDKGLTEQSTYRIHGKVWELAGKPDEYAFGRNHAFDLLGRLRNAVLSVASEIN